MVLFYIPSTLRCLFPFPLPFHHHRLGVSSVISFLSPKRKIHCIPSFSPLSDKRKRGETLGTQHWTAESEYLACIAIAIGTNTTHPSLYHLSSLPASRIPNIAGHRKITRRFQFRQIIISYPIADRYTIQSPKKNKNKNKKNTLLSLSLSSSHPQTTRAIITISFGTFRLSVQVSTAGSSVPFNHSWSRQVDLACMHGIFGELANLPAAFELL